MAKNNVNIDFSDVNVAESDLYETKKETVVIQSAVRHAIKINDITLEHNTYVKNNIINSGQMLTEPAKVVALFANEYIPEHFQVGTYIKYYLIVNGKEYEVVPINSQRNGTKTIRTSEFVGTSEYAKYISETITSVYLKIIITTPNDTETPFVSNIKLLTGGGINV